MQKKIILILLFALVVAIFAIQNANSVSIKLFQWEDEVSLAFIIIGSIAFGSLIMALVTSFTQLKLSKKIKSLKKENKEKEEKIKELEEEIKQMNEEIDKLKVENLEMKEEEKLIEKSDLLTEENNELTENKIIKKNDSGDDNDDSNKGI